MQQPEPIVEHEKHWSLQPCRYWPSDLDEARIARLTHERGHYKNCRHYQPKSERSFHCEKHEKTRHTCEGCMVCPNCGGPLYIYKKQTHRKRDRIAIDQSKSCVLCGAFLSEYFTAFIDAPTTQKQHGKCQVQGCQHTAFEQITHAEGNTIFVICLTHHRRMKTWQRHPDKTDEHKPILLAAGKLVDNENYKVKQGSR